jgi:hypothetical protein
MVCGVAANFRLDQGAIAMRYPQRSRLVSATQSQPKIGATLWASIILADFSIASAACHAEALCVDGSKPGLMPVAPATSTLVGTFGIRLVASQPLGSPTSAP